MTVLFLDGAFGVILIGFLLFCLLDVITTDPAEIRNLPKIGWLLLVFINPVGGIAWLIAGRPHGGTATASGSSSPVRRSAPTPGRPVQAPRRAVAPDDDPEFLAGLGRAATDRERMLGSWEEDLRRREEELRRRRDEDERDS